VCRARVERHFHKDTERYRASDERVRTYHAVDNRVYDHASGLTDTYQNVIIKGNIDNLIEARAKVKR
jgi:protein subunit release factor A